MKRYTLLLVGSIIASFSAGAGVVSGLGLLPPSYAASQSSSPSNVAKPSGPDFQVPSPPEEPTLINADTKYTTRFYGNDPFQLAVSVTQHIYTAAIPKDAPNIDNNVGDRPWGVILVTPDDPLAAISATPLIHFPDDAPILFVEPNGIPQVTLNEIKRLGDTGIIRDKNVDVIAVGHAANAAVVHQVEQLGLKCDTIVASNDYDLANKIDAYYGKIQNPDLGVPAMETSASTGGNGVMDVMIGATQAWQYVLPATHWVSHMPAGLLWVTKDSVPASTVDALKRRMGHANIYVFGGPQQVSRQVMQILAKYGNVVRITNDDAVDFNQPPQDTPMETSIAFAKMWDPMGMVGWNITGPGHGFTVIQQNDWQAAVASAILSHLGFHAPLLLSDNSKNLPTDLKGYFQSVAPTFLTSPADGPYNMTYIVGNYGAISWPEQAQIDYLSGMANRRVFSQNTGSLYTRP
ncbi:MAG: hypothetical protein IMW91_07370 [Firmicutes bacterium]|nr:hypothetical protein [Bacillota bacterium]